MQKLCQQNYPSVFLRYRILAFDHDLLSFVDLTFEEWPAVLITNPKSSLYSSSFHEPLVKILYSTHIRYPIIISWFYSVSQCFNKWSISWCICVFNYITYTLKKSHSSLQDCCWVFTLYSLCRKSRFYSTNSYLSCICNNFYQSQVYPFLCDQSW